ncbi:MAG: hypothetical protein ABW061_28470 [Polyangiaceae bacterium]
MRLDVVCAFSFLCILQSAGCVGRAQDAHEPGDRLGTFHASGKLVSDTCQANVLGVSNDWAFDVKLSREANTLYWLNGEEAIPGTIAVNGTTFGFQSGVEVTLEAARGVQPGCIILRSDNASGELSSKTSNVKSFSVDMSFSYSVKSGTECAGYVGVQDGFAGLPCKVSYSLTAQRTALPPSLD